MRHNKLDTILITLVTNFGIAAIGRGGPTPATEARVPRNASEPLVIIIILTSDFSGVGDRPATNKCLYTRDPVIL